MKDFKISIFLGTFQRRYGVRKALEIAKNVVGVDYVDYTLDDFYSHRSDRHGSSPDYLYDQSEDALIAYFTELRSYIDSLGLTVAQTHGRSTIFYDDPEEDAAVLSDARIDLLATRILGAKHCVMHCPSGARTHMMPAEQVDTMHYEFFSKLAPIARENGVKIAIETGGNSGSNYEIFGRFCHAEHFVRAYERLVAHPEFRDVFCCCVDTGHSNMAAKHEGEPTVPDLTRRLGSAVEVLHINDNEGKTDMHAVPMPDSHPFTGAVDWWDFFRALDEIGYTGYYNLELGFNNYCRNFAIEEAIFSVKVLKNLLQTHYGLPHEGFIDDTPYLSESFQERQRQKLQKQKQAQQ